MAFEWQQFSVSGARMTRDPEEPKTFSGVKSIRFGIAFTGERRKDKETGEWENNPVFLDCEAVQFEKGQKIVEAIEEKGKKGCKLSLIVGTLKMEQWEDKNGGGKRTAIKLKVTEIIFADAAAGSDGSEGYRESRNKSQKKSGGYGGDTGGSYGEPDPNDPLPF